MALVNSKLMNFLTRFSKRTLICIPLGLAAILCLSISAKAHAEQVLKMKISASKLVQDEKGKSEYIPVSTAQPGSIIQYKATYQNTLNQSINNTTVTIPIPTNTEFTGDAFPRSAQGSVDYHNYMDIPLMRIVSGKLVEIPFSEYKSLRWDIKYIPAKKSVDVAFNTLVK